MTTTPGARTVLFDTSELNGVLDRMAREACALQRVSAVVDEVVCLLRPDDFRAVGEYYRDFAQVEDAEVITLLRR